MHQEQKEEQDLKSIEDCVDTTIQGLEQFTKKELRKTNYNSQ